MAAKFVVWHYGEGIRNIWRVYANFTEFFWRNLSVTRFLVTLFSPWKRDVSRVGRRGFHPILFFSAFIENIFTRFIGAMLRIVIIALAIILEALAFVMAVAVFLFWLLLPLIFLVSLGQLVFAFREPGSVFTVWAAVFAVGLFLMVASLRAFKSRNKDYSRMNMEELGRQKWFGRAWNRMGVSNNGLRNLLTDQESLRTFLKDQELSEEEFRRIVNWEMAEEIAREKKKKFWLKENLMANRPVGINWTYAYTVKLDRHSRDLSEGDHSEYRDAELVGLGRQLDELSLILTRSNQNSVILIGEPGVGRDTIIHALARNIRRNRAIPQLANKRILEISLKEILSRPASAENEELLHSLFHEAAYAGNAVLVLRDIHDYLGTGGKGATDISPILGEYLGLASFQMIGTTTPDLYHEYVEKKDRMMKYCDKIMVPEMTKDDAMTVLLCRLRKIERKRVLVTYQAAREIINLSERYLSDAPFPEKALDLLEEVMIDWSQNPSGPLIDKAAVDRMMTKKIDVPLGEIMKGESDKLLDLENILHKRVVGQDMAINQIAEAIRRARIGMVQPDKPLGSFLFMGPTGVGKTESAKALAEAYFGDEKRMIRLDMSEYQTDEAISQLIGSPSGGQEGYLVSKVKETPHALLLVDEIEKSNPSVLNLFLQVLDEGCLKDAKGKKVDFRNLIIIATSNAGSEVIKESIQSGMNAKDIQERVTQHVIEKGIFKTELLNRFGGVVFFHPLSPDDISKVTHMLLLRHAERIKEQENITVSFEDGVSEVIAQKAFDPIFGARAVNRYIESKLEDNLVKKIISGELKKGDSYQVSVPDVS